MPRDKRKTEFNPKPKEARQQPQMALFEAGKSWQNEWQSMPEFVQHNLKSWKDIKVHFENREDMEAFAELVDQRITLDTHFIWYPEATIGKFTNMAVVDKPNPDPNDFPEGFEIPEGMEIIDEEQS